MHARKPNKHADIARIHPHSLRSAFFLPVQRSMSSTLQPRSRSAPLASSMHLGCLRRAMRMYSSALASRTAGASSRVRATRLRSARHAARCRLRRPGCRCMALVMTLAPLFSTMRRALTGLRSASAARAAQPASATRSFLMWRCMTLRVTSMPPMAAISRLTSSLPAIARKTERQLRATRALLSCSESAAVMVFRTPRSTTCWQNSLRTVTRLRTEAISAHARSLLRQRSRAPTSSASAFRSSTISLITSCALPKGTRMSSSWERARSTCAASVTTGSCGSASLPPSVSGAAVPSSRRRTGVALPNELRSTSTRPLATKLWRFGSCLVQALRAAASPAATTSGVSWCFFIRPHTKAMCASATARRVSALA
eukprot:m.298025 g.298025  ORF g.298025 m.298025 type:complete len:370 (-) comp13762_c0_seq1:509-1618(-)